MDSYSGLRCVFLLLGLPNDRTPPNFGDDRVFIYRARGRPVKKANTRDSSLVLVARVPAAS